jgi:hypothetical protein
MRTRKNLLFMFPPITRMSSGTSAGTSGVLKPYALL